MAKTRLGTDRSIELVISSIDSLRIGIEENESSDSGEDDGDLIERGPTRPQLCQNLSFRSRPYQAYNVENAADLDTSAKAILTDSEYREKIDCCLSKLDQARWLDCAQSSQDHRDDAAAAAASSIYGKAGLGIPTGPNDSEDLLLEILSQGGFQSAQLAPESPANVPSRPESRASSNAPSPGNPPQMTSSWNFPNFPRPSSSSSSSQSYCSVPSPAEYCEPLQLRLENQLNEDLMSRNLLFESSETLVNSVDSRELQLQLVEEVIRDMDGDSKPLNGSQIHTQSNKPPTKLPANCKGFAEARNYQQQQCSAPPFTPYNGTIAPYGRDNPFCPVYAKRMERSIAPWPSLNLPETGASERLKQATSSRDVARAMKNLLKKPLCELTSVDADGDTMLMCLLGNPDELKAKLAYLAPLVERLAAVEGALSTKNNRGEDALYLAAIKCPEYAFVAGYLAATMLQKGIDIARTVYRAKGDSLIHALAARGDANGSVLAELLSLKDADGKPAFDLSKRNYEGRCPLHVAVESHNTIGANGEKVVCVGTVKLLVENGADPTIREVKRGDTPLHMALFSSPDVGLVKALLAGKGRDAVNIGNYNGNTPMHEASALCSKCSLERQTEILLHLLHVGGLTSVKNRQGKSPLVLVSTERKEAIRRIFHRKC